MSITKISHRLVFSIFFASTIGAFAQDSIPDFTKGDKIPDGHVHDWNLGPTGARGWIFSKHLATSEARQILVTKVDKGSPAEKILKVDDVILGVGRENFEFDPRVELGRAIAKAESASGTLVLKRWRDGKTKEVTIKLPVLGEYSSTAPFDCDKSSRILEIGCEVLAARMNANPKYNRPIPRCYNTLALLASGNKKYLPVIEKQIQWAAQYSDLEAKTLHCWFYGPVNLLLAEYILATGDTKYLPQLERITMEIVNGQSAIGSWGHRFARPDGWLNGYGMMNAPGLPLVTSLILARQAGVRDSKLDEAIEKNRRLIRFYVGKGAVPYGDHAPWIETHDDNGKNGIAALMFNLLGDQEAATYYSRMSVAAHNGERELGHTGNYFNMLWAMPGVALSGPEASGAWLKEYGWYYDLARRWDGTFQHQGPAQPKNDSYHRWDATGAYLLAFAQVRRSLFITGRKSDVVEAVERREAEKLINAGRGFRHRSDKKHSFYNEKSDQELLKLLADWSPVVRERAAIALAGHQRTSDDKLAKDLIAMLQSENLNARIGACQAIAQIGGKAKTTVPYLREVLQSDDLWLRVKAAYALAGIGDAARVAVPDLLKLLSETDAEKDPRGMLQRFVSFALFDRREGLLRSSLDGVDREMLYRAVKAGLQNEDGRARGTIANVYKNLSYEQIEPLLPSIHRATVEAAPSGNMFADGVRLAGLDVLAKHRIEEGMQLCVDLIDLERWSSGNRLPKCLATLRRYGTAAKPLSPQLKTLQSELTAKFNRKRKLNKQDKAQLEAIQKTLDVINGKTKPPELRPLSAQ